MSIASIMAKCWWKHVIICFGLDLLRCWYCFFLKINKQNEWIRDKPAPVNKRLVWALKSEFEAAGVDGRHSKQHIRLEWHQCTAVRLPPWMSFVFTVMLHLFKWRLLAKLTVRTSTNVLSHRVALTLLLNYLPTLKKLELNSCYWLAKHMLSNKAVKVHPSSCTPNWAAIPPTLEHLCNADLPLDKLVWCQQRTSSLQSPLSQSERLSSARLVIMLLTWGKGVGGWGRRWKAILLTNGLQSYQLRLSEA